MTHINKLNEKYSFIADSCHITNVCHLSHFSQFCFRVIPMIKPGLCVLVYACVFGVRLCLNMIIIKVGIYFEQDCVLSRTILGLFCTISRIVSKQVNAWIFFKQNKSLINLYNRRIFFKVGQFLGQFIQLAGLCFQVRQCLDLFVQMLDVF